MLKIMGVVALLALAGCTADVMKGWVGHSETELLASWGAPDKTAQSGGKKFHTWDGRNGAGQIICTRTFVIDASGFVQSFSTNCP